MSCGVDRRCGSDLALLWLWCRLAAIAPIVPLAWEPPCAEGVALKRQKDQKQKQKKMHVETFIRFTENIECRRCMYRLPYRSRISLANTLVWMTFFFFFFAFLEPHSQHVEVLRLGVKSELPLLAYVTATQDLSYVWQPSDT